MEIIEKALGSELEDLEVELDTSAKADSEVKIIVHILQSVSVENINEILIVSEREPCQFCDGLLQAFVNKHPWIELTVEWFKTLTGEEIPGKKSYYPSKR